jgi:hypothetical protein
MKINSVLMADRFLVFLFFHLLQLRPGNIKSLLAQAFHIYREEMDGHTGIHPVQTHGAPVYFYLFPECLFLVSLVYPWEGVGVGAGIIMKSV